MDFHSFLTSLGTSFLIFVVLMLLFSWLSKKPGNREIYYPNRILKGMEANEDLAGFRNPTAWIREAISSTEQDVIAVSGVDTAVYFVFLSTVLGILALSGVVLLPVLLPIAATDDNVKKTLETTSNGTFGELDNLSLGNVEPKSPRLWAFLLATYWVSFVTYYLLWKAYKHVTDLRANALMSPEVRSEQFTVLVRDIPPVPEGQTRKEQIDSYFKALYPDTFYRSLVITDNKEVDKIWKELVAYRKKLARAEAVYAEAQKTGKGTKPTHKIGCLGLVGKKVDSIQFYSEKIDELIPKLEAEQKVTLKEKQLGAALVFFTKRVVAASAAQNLHDKAADSWTVIEAPEPRQLIWANLKIKFFERVVRQYVVYVIVALTITFYMIPIGLISAFTTLGNLKKLLPFLNSILDIAAVKTVLEAYLPQIALLVFLALLPTLLLFLSKREGIPSFGHAVRASSGKYFYFTVLNVFIGVTIGGIFFSTFKSIQSIQSIQKDPDSLVTLLAASLPGNATFFLTFVALRFFVGYGLELSRIIPLIIYHIKKKYLCKTEAELKEAWFPGDLKYGTRVPSDMLIITIVLCYSVIAPVIIPFGVAYFGLGWLILRNQALKVYVPSYESDGRMWPHMQVRVIAALVLYQVTMFGYFLAKKFYYAPLLIVLPILSLIYAYVTSKKYYPFFSNPALVVANQELKEPVNMEHIFRSYIPPSLSSEKIDDDHHQYVDAFSLTRTELVV